MTTITKRGRRRSLGVLAAAATIAFVGASTASATTVPPGTESIRNRCRRQRSRRGRGGRHRRSLRRSAGGGPGQPDRPPTDVGQLRGRHLQLQREVSRASRRRCRTPTPSSADELTPSTPSAAPTRCPTCSTSARPRPAGRRRGRPRTRTSRRRGTRSPTTSRTRTATGSASYYGVMAFGVNTTLVRERPADVVRRPQRPAVRRPGGAQRRSSGSRCGLRRGDGGLARQRRLASTTSCRASSTSPTSRRRGIL